MLAPEDADQRLVDGHEARLGGGRLVQHDGGDAADGLHRAQHLHLVLLLEVDGLGVADDVLAADASAVPPELPEAAGDVALGLLEVEEAEDVGVSRMVHGLLEGDRGLHDLDFETGDQVESVPGAKEDFQIIRKGLR